MANMSLHGGLSQMGGPASSEALLREVADHVRKQVRGEFAEEIKELRRRVRRVERELFGVAGAGIPASPDEDG